jgi:hypothetical protein
VGGVVKTHYVQFAFHVFAPSVMKRTRILWSQISALERVRCSIDGLYRLLGKHQVWIALQRLVDALHGLESSKDRSSKAYTVHGLESSKDRSSEAQLRVGSGLASHVCVNLVKTTSSAANTFRCPPTSQLTFKTCRKPFYHRVDLGSSHPCPLDSFSWTIEADQLPGVKAIVLLFEASRRDHVIGSTGMSSNRSFSLEIRQQVYPIMMQEHSCAISDAITASSSPPRNC